MSKRDSNRRQTRRTEPTDVTPERRRSASELLGKMASLDHAGEGLGVHSTRERLRSRAEEMGMRLVSMTITREPIPDPELEALPREDYDRIETISSELYTRLGAHVEELERLSEKYPHIPMLRNHLAGALSAAGEHERADKVVERMAREFPKYLFGFCNYVMLLIRDGKVDEARALVETGPRGPLFTLTQFDPTRDTFHITEATTHGAMVGHYLLVTGRHEAAGVQLKMLRELEPESLQCRCLAEAMARGKGIVVISEALRRLKSGFGRRTVRGTTNARRPPRSAGK